MAVEISKERALYSFEALAIIVALPLSLNPYWLGIPLLLSLPALVLAVIGIVRPRYFDPVGFTDPRRGLRRYLHAWASLSGVAALVVVVAIVFR